MKVLILILLSVSFTHANAKDGFYDLRQKHLSEMVAQSFVADLEEKSADLLINKKIEKPYRVELDYDVNKGLNLLVKDTDPFYERMLSTYIYTINNMMFPLLNTAAYTRLQKRFTIEKKKGDYSLSFEKGDLLVEYVFKVGKLGLVDKIEYLESGKKIYALTLEWKLVDKKYIPTQVKSTSYVKTKKSVSFKIENIRNIK